MKALTRFGLFAVIGLIVLAGGACRKKENAQTGSKVPEAASGPASASNLPGANDVLRALEKKDYDAAISALVTVRQNVVDSQQQLQFATLADEAKILLLEAAPKNPKAAEALAALRRITAGR